MQKPPHRPWVIAHRGASRVLRENTLPAFREAYARGADAAEMDVRRTADGSLVVHHDAAIPDAGPIVGLTRAELKAAAPWVPDLTDALAACAGMWVNVEVKNSPADPDWDPTQDVARRVAAELGASGSVDRYLISSFDPSAITAAAEALPGVRTGWLADAGSDPVRSLALAAGAGHTSFHPNVEDLSGDAAARVVGAARAAGLLVLVWTVDDTEEMIRLADAGVDGIITNLPAAARSAFEHRHGDGG